MNLPMWLYWEGLRPEWIDACLRTHSKHWPDVRLLTRADFYTHWTENQELRPKFEKLCLSHQSDVIRAYMLAKHGGMWCDADCIIFRPLAPLFQLLSNHEFVCGPQHDKSICAAFVLSQPKGKIATAWYARQVELLRAKSKFEWLDFGSNALMNAIWKTQAPYYRMHPDVGQPVWWDDPSAFFVRRKDGDHVPHVVPMSYAYMLSNNSVQGIKGDLLHPETFFSFLLRCSTLNQKAAPIRVEGKVHRGNY